MKTLYQKYISTFLICKYSRVYLYWYIHIYMINAELKCLFCLYEWFQLCLWPTNVNINLVIWKRMIYFFWCILSYFYVYGLGPEQFKYFSVRSQLCQCKYVYRENRHVYIHFFKLVIKEDTFTTYFNHIPSSCFTNFSNLKNYENE